MTHFLLLSLRASEATWQSHIDTERLWDCFGRNYERILAMTNRRGASNDTLSSTVIASERSERGNLILTRRDCGIASVEIMKEYSQ